MTVREDVLAAPNPKAALLVLADAIDSLQSKPADLWEDWGSELESFDATVEAVESIGATGEPTQGGPFTQATDDGSPVVDFPLPTKTQEIRRKNVIEHLDFENLTGRDDNGNEYRLFPREDTPERREEVKELLRAYFNAGPVWLYLSNRDHVLQLPLDVRREMIADVEEVDPKYAYHMAKDILMDRDDQGADRDVLPMRSDPTGVVA